MIRDQVVAVFESVAKAQRKTLQPLRDDLPLAASGLDSLCLAVIVARLESELGSDPFSRDENVMMPTTFGEFVSLYEGAVV